MYFIDTCVLVQGYEKHSHAPGKIFEEMKKGNPEIALIDFTLKELVHVEKHKILEEIDNVKVYETGVSPGEWNKEKGFEKQVDSELLKLIPDPSDAVLVAACEKFGAKGVVTKDRHHLYTAKLYNYLQQKNLVVLEAKEFVEKVLK